MAVSSGKRKRSSAPAPVSRSTSPPGSVSVAPETQTRAPAEWLDRLLSASNVLSPEATPREAVSAVLAAVLPSLEGCALGVHAPEATERAWVVRLGAFEGEADPARLFPHMGAETVHTVPGARGATLHVGAADAAGAVPPPVLLDRVLATLGAVLARARAAEARRTRGATVRGSEDPMIHAERLAGLGQIAAGIVHDLNTPLTTVVAYAEVLRKKWSTATDVDEGDKLRLMRIHEAAEHLLGFSRELMTYARPAPYVPGPVDAKEVLERALAFCEHAVSTSRVVIERDFLEVRPVRGVAGQLIQVFVNLITNACQAVRQDGTGRLSLSVRWGDDGLVHITVADDGEGLPEEKHRLFEPFFTTKDGGTGLGLAIVHKIVATHGGTVDAVRLTPSGTAFVVRLPPAAGAPT